jgi:hypothetical protein
MSVPVREMSGRNFAIAVRGYDATTAQRLRMDTTLEHIFGV